MLLNPAASAIKAGPVARQTASVNKTGPVFKPKSLVQLAAEKIEQSIKKPAVLPKQNNQLSTTLGAHALVKDKINYWEKKANENSSIITLDKKPIDIADMREDEMAKSRILQNAPGSTIQNLFENRLDQIPGKQERVQVMMNADVENWNEKTRMITPKTFGPFTMEMPKMSNDVYDLYNIMVYKLLKYDFSIL